MRNNKNPFKDERVARVQRDIFTTSRGVVSLFKSVSDEVVPKDGQLILEALADKDYQRILFSNPYRTAEHLALYRACRESKFPYLIVERGALPDSIFLDQTGFLADSTLYDALHWRRPLSTDQITALAQFKYMYSQLQVHLEDQPRRRQEPEFEELKQGQRTVFIPLQVRSDTVLRFFSNGRSYDEFLREISSLAMRHQSVRFVYKPHPQDVNVEIEGAYRCDWHIDDLIQASDRIITFNSGVGVLALLRNKPVAVYGNAFYAKEDIVKKILKNEDMDTFVTDDNLSIPTDLQDQFLFHLTNRVYSNVRFLSRPLAQKNARKIAMKVNTVRVCDPINGCFIEVTEPSASSFVEYSGAVVRFLRNRLDETFRLCHRS